MASDVPRLHFVGVCGRAMAGIAAELALQDWSVSGVDRRRFEPAASEIEAAGVLLVGPEDPLPETDLLVISAAESAEHPHLRAAAQRGIAIQSFAEFLGERFLAGSRNLVVAGTNGKTTTTAMLIWILQQAGRDPDYLIGGRLCGLERSARLRGAPFVVLEGDEYPAGLPGSLPKFAHYRPWAMALTNVHPDHPEVFSTAEEYGAAFERVISELPADGLLVCNADDAEACALAGHSSATSLFVGLGESASPRIKRLQPRPEGEVFEFLGENVLLPMHGEINVRNAAMAMVMARAAGVAPTDAAEALACFPGVEERQQVLIEGEGAVLLVDEAYHPHALAGLFEAIAARYPGRRRLAIYRARYVGSRRGAAQRDLPAALSGADVVVLAPAFQGDAEGEDRFDDNLLAKQTGEAGAEVHRVESIQEVPSTVRRISRAGDVIVSLYGTGKPGLLAALGEVAKELNET